MQNSFWIEIFLAPNLQALMNLFGIAAILTFFSYILMWPNKRKQGDVTHPLFGKYTVNVPNIMSWFRFPFGAWIVFVYSYEPFHTTLMMFSVHLSFAIVCLLDILDGKFARKWNAITEDGKSLDPLADKFVTFCLAVAAYLYGELRWWAILIVIAREVVAIIQRALLKRKGIDVSARWLGKIKTGVQFSVLYIILLRIGVPPDVIGLDTLAKLFLPNFILWGMLLLCVCTIISLFPFFTAFSYVHDYGKSQREESNKAWYIVSIPNLFTIGNYLCGITAIFFSMPEIQVEYRPFVVLFWVCSAAVCDALDGPIARRLKSHSEFGSCLDSSIDLSTFGLAVATIIFLQFTALKETMWLWGIFVAGFYFIFVHLRLARFTRLKNLEADQSKKRDFVGLPSPSGALGVLIVFTFFEHIPIISILIIFLSLLMYSKFDFISHSNSIRHPLYRYFLIPVFWMGFGLLFFLIFQQPFISAHTSRELIVYFKICSWLLSTCLLFYVAHGLWRGKVKNL